MSDRVDVEIPLRSRFASTVRAVAAAVCADLGFSVDAIDDLRLGVNEAVALLSDVDAPESARLRIGFTPGEDAVRVECRRIGVDAAFDPSDIDVLAQRILDAVVDSYSVDDEQIVLTKRLA